MALNTNRINVAPNGGLINGTLTVADLIATGSLEGIASGNIISASFTSGTLEIFYGDTVTSSSVNFTSGTFEATASHALTASYVETASYIDPLTQDVYITGSLNINGDIFAKNLYVSTVSSSVIYESGSTKFGDSEDDTHQFTGSVSITGSLTLDGPLNATASHAITASYVNITGSGVIINYNDSEIQITGSAEVFPYTGSAIVSGSVITDEVIIGDTFDTTPEDGDWKFAISESKLTVQFYDTASSQWEVDTVFTKVPISGSSFVTFTDTASYAFFAVNAATASYAPLAETASYVPIIGKGITVNGMQLTASVLSVNGTFPEADGNIATALTEVITGTSASLSLSSSGAVTASINNGSVWIISNDSDPALDGLSYIWSSGSGEWYQLNSFDYATADARYLKLLPQAPLQGALDLGGFNLQNVGDPILTSDAASIGWMANFGSASYVNLTSSTITINYNGSEIQLTGSEGGGATVVVTGSISGSYNSGSLWYNTDTKNLYVQTADPSGSDWVISTVLGLQDVVSVTGSTSASIDIWDGVNPNTTGSFTFTQGLGVIATGTGSHAQGGDTRAFGLASHAEGQSTIASGSYSHAEGQSTISLGDHSHAEGFGTIAIGEHSHTEGDSTTAIGEFSHAEGQLTKAIGENSHAEGEQTTAIGKGSHAEGGLNSTIGQHSHAEGANSQAIGTASHTEGDFTRTFGIASHAEGYQTSASGSYSHTEGYTTTTVGLSSHAEGITTTAKGDYSHAEGSVTTAIGNFSHAEGSSTRTIGFASHAEGVATTTTGFGSHAEGNTTFAVNAGDHTEGLNTRAEGQYSHAEGNLVTTLGIYSHAEGQLTTTVGSHSHAEGRNTRAIGIGSHAEGQLTTAIGIYSHAEGEQTKALAVGDHAEGEYTVASAGYSHAEGFATTTLGQYSHAEGNATITSKDFQHVEGVFNREDTNALWIVGDGTSNVARKNLIAGYTNKITITGSLDVTGPVTASAFKGRVVTISDTAPTTDIYSTGSLWFNSDNLGLYVRYQDIDGGQWVSVNPVGPIATASYADTAGVALFAQELVGSGWSANETTVITATTTAPTKGTTSYDYTRYRQVNSDTYEVQVNFNKISGGSDGSGDYIFNLPAGLTFSSTTPKTTSLTESTILQFVVPTAGTFSDGTGRFRPIGIVPYNNNQYRIAVMDSGTSITMFGTGVRMTIASIVAFKLQFYTNF